MKLQFKERYRSIGPLATPVELPDFTIITGLNGSGKTHLLEGMAKNPNTGENPIWVLDDQGARLVPIRLADSVGLAPTDAPAVSQTDLQREVDQTWGYYENPHGRVGRQPSSAERRQFRSNHATISAVAARAGKDIDALGVDDFAKYLPFVHEARDAFGNSFARLFMRYQVARTENEFRQFQARKAPHEGIEFLADDEFVAHHGEPPWILVNDIIGRAGLGYTLNHPRPTGSVHAPFELKLTRADGLELKFSDLSSGEKVLMALGLATYNAKDPDIKFPRVLLLDEPDAHLHPSMARQMLGVLHDVFVAQRNVKVVITTHSPSTVALAPDDSLFAMNRVSRCPERTTKDAALSLLTSGVPTLSVLHENRRQVFVESEHDADRFERLYKRLRLAEALSADVSLTFINSGIGGSGSCDAVRAVVEKLRAGGNRFVWGIVDWDGTAAEAPGIAVLGLGRRHSIENYILDPVVIGAFLLRDKAIDKTVAGIDYPDVRAADTKHLQALADAVVDKVRPHVKDVSDETREWSVYWGHVAQHAPEKKHVLVPRWYLRTQGHALETALTKAFSALNKWGPEDFKLKREVVRTVLDDLPELLPHDIVDLLSAIQSARLPASRVRALHNARKTARRPVEGLALAFEQADAHASLGIAYRNLGDRARSAEHYAKAAELFWELDMDAKADECQVAIIGLRRGESR